MRPFDFTDAIVRLPGRSVVDGLRDGNHAGPNYEGVLAEHALYIDALRGAGVAVEVLPPLDAFPDSIFVEDPALVFQEAAILLRPGAPTRAAEVAEIAPVLRRRFERVIALEQGHSDGGDVLVTAERVYIGLSARTDRTGAAALVEALASIGRIGVVVAPPPGVLHLKTGCTLIDEETILATAQVAASGLFDGFHILTVPEGEEAGANALRVNDRLFCGSAFPRLQDLLARHGYALVALPVHEVGKIDAGLSCMSLRWTA